MIRVTFAVCLAVGLCAQGATGQNIAPDLDRYRLVPCSSAEQKRADCVLHVNCNVEGIGQAVEHLYFRRQTLAREPREKMIQRLGGSSGSGTSFNGDGVSARTGKGIGFGGGCSVWNIQPDGIVVSFMYHWTTEDDQDALRCFIVFPYDREFTIRVGKLAAKSSFEWITK